MDPVAAARRLADELLFPRALETDRAAVVPVELLDALAAAGLYGLAGPDGPRPGAAREIVEVLAGGCLTTTFVWMQHHRAVRAVARAGGRLREEWLGPLCLGARRAGVAFSALRRPGPPALVARPAPGGWIFDGSAPWVSGWGRIDVLFAAARDGGRIVWALLDAVEGPTLRAEPLELAAVAASATVTVRLDGHRAPAERVALIEPFEGWAARDAVDLRSNGSFALGLARRCSMLLGPGAGPLEGDVDACRAALDGAAGAGLAASGADLAAARARASALALRAATALVVSGGGRSMLLQQHGQRLAREALFLLVLGQTGSIREAQLRLLGIDGG